MTTPFSPIRKQSASSSQNTRDISMFDLNKFSISAEECLELDFSSPLKDLDRDGQKIPYSLAVQKEHTTFILPQSNLNDKFYKRFKEELTEKKEELFRSVKKGNLERMRDIMRQYPIPVTVRQTKYYDNSLLHQSIKNNHLDISLLLLKRDIGLLNQQNNQGRTPVHFAMIYIRDLFIGLLEDHLEQINWALTDDNKITYDEYVDFYQYDYDIYKKVRFAVKDAIAKNKKLTQQKQMEQTLFFTPGLKKYQSQMLIEAPPPKLRSARSQYVQRPKRISSMYDIKETVFTIETGISDFVILKQLGEGCFAKVYKVKHIPSNNIYAMKVFLKSKITHQIMKYIISEKNILMRLSHPFLINAYCSFETPELYCYVMDCCQGTLKDILNKEKQLSQSRIKSIACELISVIGYLHQNGVIYRDLKPENIGYDQSGHITLIDFGLSKDGLTGSSFCGSYLYLPPEMITARQYNCTVDWYMLGAVLYELSTGKTPFLASDKQGLIQKIMRQQPKQLSGVSLEMIDFINKLLEKNHANRLGSEQDSYQLMQHPWFDDIEWNSIPKRRYKIPIPEPSKLHLKKSINENAQQYFKERVEHKTEYDFIEVPRWASVKQLH